MTHASRKLGNVGTPSPAHAAVVSSAGERRGEFRRGLTALAALGSLALISSVALGSMYAIGSLVHAVVPSRQFDILYVLHNRIVVLALIGVTVLWLIPPYPSVVWVRERPAVRGRHVRVTTRGAAEPPAVATSRRRRGNGDVERYLRSGAGLGVNR